MNVERDFLVGDQHDYAEEEFNAQTAHDEWCFVACPHDDPPSHLEQLHRNSEPIPGRELVEEGRIEARPDEEARRRVYRIVQAGNA